MHSTNIKEKEIRHEETTLLKGIGMIHVDSTNLKGIEIIHIDSTNLEMKRMKTCGIPLT